jgi:hypothetical protein
MTPEDAARPSPEKLEPTEKQKFFGSFFQKRTASFASAVCDLFDSPKPDESRSSPLFWRACLSGG